MTGSRLATSGAASVALWMAAHRGWRVLPLNPGTKKPLGGCSACPAGDHPPGDCPCLARADGALCHGVWAASNDPAIVTRWARRRRPSDVWGLHLGASGLLAVDLDAHGGTAPRHPLNGLDWPDATPAPVDGIDVFAALAGLHGAGFDDHRTLCTQTPSGGLHLIYAAEPGRWKSSSGRARPGEDTVRTGIGWQIDIKSYAGYVVIPSSTTTTGHYERVSPTVDVIGLPAWLTAVLVRTGHDRHAQPAPAPGPPVEVTVRAEAGRDGAYAAGALRSACAELAGMAPDTGRNRKLFRSASRMAGMVEAGWIDRDQVDAALTEAARQAGLPAGEITYTLASGFRNPRSPEPRRSAA
nr:bifunctional DNA primase/polymerase [Kibdelosporangium sp. MJ126-NF4]CEL19675.1 hypothetical protein [Kibdelosporangium sp. MJ126-NF4]CTQ94525.1 hypothetical protein [Kibdelosporangium sp. MJ126-NF4]